MNKSSECEALARLVNGGCTPLVRLFFDILQSEPWYRAAYAKLVLDRLLSESKP